MKPFVDRMRQALPQSQLVGLSLGEDTVTFQFVHIGATIMTKDTNTKKLSIWFLFALTSCHIGRLRDTVNKEYHPMLGW